jgi:acyl-CoA thioesterase II
MMRSPLGGQVWIKLGWERMAKPLDDLVALLRLERLEENRFRGHSQDPGWGTVFGGQALGQALSAAIQTVPVDRQVHSLHAYFLRPGDVARPIVYEVERIRDGRSFATRRVVANQGAHAIFAMSCSFQVDEAGLEHQAAMPPAPAPETLPTEQQRAAPFLAAAPEAIRVRLLAERPFEIRTADQTGDDPFAPARGEPRRLMWMRTIDALPDEPALHACLLAYVSDYQFGTTALVPHGVSWMSPSVQLASIDHVIWFHRPFRCDDWLLHVIESPTGQAARGLVRGAVFTRDGRLVASTAQEGLIRSRV